MSNKSVKSRAVILTACAISLSPFGKTAQASWDSLFGGGGSSSGWGYGKKEKDVDIKKFSPEIQALLNKETMPTVEDVLKAFPQGIPEKNPMGSDSYSKASQVKEHLNGLAEMVALFERAFPGATFYALGRDASYLGDVLDAIYTSIGQSGRVKRLDLSQTSFQSKLGETPDGVLQYLKDNIGFNPKELINGAPIVVFDTTSFSASGGVGGYGNGFSASSQSRKVIEAMYLGLKKETKMTHEEMVRKANFIAVSGYYKDGGGKPVDEKGRVDYFFDFDTWFAKQAASVGTRPGFLGVDYPLVIEQPTTLTYYDRWHEMFEALRRSKSGKFESPPGPQSSNAEKVESLGELIATIKTINSEARLKGWVDGAASKLGYEFPLHRSLTLKIDADFAVRKERIRAQKEAEERERVQALIRENQKTIDKLVENMGLSKDGASYLIGFKEEAKTNARRNVDEAMASVKARLKDLIDRKGFNLQDRVAAIKQILGYAHEADVEGFAKMIAAATKVSSELKEAVQAIQFDEKGSGKKKGSKSKTEDILNARTVLSEKHRENMVERLRELRARMAK